MFDDDPAPAPNSLLPGQATAGTTLQIILAAHARNLESLSLCRCSFYEPWDESLLPPSLGSQFAELKIEPSGNYFPLKLLQLLAASTKVLTLHGAFLSFCAIGR